MAVACVIDYQGQSESHPFSECVRINPKDRENSGDMSVFEDNIKCCVDD